MGNKNPKLPLTLKNMYKIWDIICNLIRGSDLVDHISGYVASRVALLKAEINEELSRILSRGLTYVAIFFLLALFLLFMGVGLALYLNVIFDRDYAGFCIVAGIYLLTFLLMFIMRRGIVTKIQKNITTMTKETDN